MLYARDGLFTSHNDHFRRDPLFRAAYDRGIAASNGFDPQTEWRVHIALWLAQRAKGLRGHFVECGVNAGFVSSAIMQRLDWRGVGKTFFLIDTFDGPVVTQYSPEEIAGGRLKVSQDAIAKGSYVTDLQRVQANYAEWPNVRIVQGVVPNILLSLEIEEVAFLHLDMNCAYPECAALEHFWQLLSPGGIVLFDDYAYFGNEHLAGAIDSVARSLDVEVLSLPTRQGLLIK